MEKIKIKIIFLMMFLITSCTLQDFKPQPQNLSPEKYQPINYSSDKPTQNQTNTTPIVVPAEPVLLPISNKLAVYIIDTSKKGSAIVTLNNNSILVNAQGQADGLRLLKIIKNLGIKKINYLIATNGDEGNIAGISPILLRIPPAKLIHSGIPSLAPSYSTYTSLYKNITLVPHDDIFGFEESFVNLIVPYDDGIPLSDDNSIVVKINYGNTQVLITTDCAVDCESRIGNVKASILISNGGCNSLSYIFLQDVLPELVVFSGKPCEETQKRIESLDLPYLYTERDGDIVISSDGINFEYKNLKS